MIRANTPEPDMSLTSLLNAHDPVKCLDDWRQRKRIWPSWDGTEQRPCQEHKTPGSAPVLLVA